MTLHSYSYKFTYKMNRNFKFLLTFLIFYAQQLSAQEINLIKNETVDALVDKKFKMNNAFSTYTNYSIQLASTKKEQAEIIYNDFRKKNPTVDATIVYTQPNFKVLVGNFRNKIEAAHFLKNLRKEHPNAFIVRLKK